MLQITNFKPTLIADSNGKVNVGGAGSAIIGGTGGLVGSMEVALEFPKIPIPPGLIPAQEAHLAVLANTTSLLGTPPPSATIKISHAGGWKPFGNLFPSFVTSSFEKSIQLGESASASSTSARKFADLIASDDPHAANLLAANLPLDPTKMSFEKKLTVSSPVVLGDGLLTMTGASATTGPDFVVSLHQSPGKKADFGAYFESVVCVPLSTPQSCFKMQASAKMNADVAVMELNAPMVLVAPPGGGATPTESKPLSTISDLPDDIKNALVIPSSTTNLIKVTVDAAKKELRFDMGALLKINIPKIGNLKKITLAVQGKGYGTFDGSKTGGVFVASFPPGYSPFAYAEDSEAFKRLKQFTGMPISLSALEGLPIAVFGDKSKVTMTQP